MIMDNGQEVFAREIGYYIVTCFIHFLSTIGIHMVWSQCQ